MTYIEEIETALFELKEHLLREFGDHIAVHNAVSDLRTKVLTASSRVSTPVEEKRGDKSEEGPSNGV